MIKNIKFIKYFIVFLFFLSNIELNCKQNKLKIHFIDVGEGDSIFIEFPDNKNVLIDTGNVISGTNVYNYLKKIKIKKIDNLIITHPHPDHYGGVFLVAQFFKIDNFYDNSEDINKEIEKNDFYRWYNDFFRMDNRYRSLKKGDILNFDNAKLEILWPNGNYNKDWNANSLVMMLMYENFKILLMGDANKLTENELLNADIDIKADIFKAGHHGAGDTGSMEFINKVDPKILIICVNKNNIREYPSKDAVEKFKQIGAHIYTTFEHGNIIIEVNDKGKYLIKFRRN